MSDSASTANLYLNCVISYELLILLRNNDRIVRHTPPTFQRVSLQAAGVYLLSIVMFCINYFVYLKVHLECTHNGLCTDQKVERIHNASLWPSIVVTYILPISFFFLVWITIKYRNYMPSLTGKWKELVSIKLFYFLFTLWNNFIENFLIQPIIIPCLSHLGFILY